MVFVFMFSVTARAETFYAYLNGAQQVPAAATSGTGFGRFFVNTTTMTYTFTVVFNGLGSAQTLSHIHAPAAIGANAAVTINFGTVGGTSGTISGSGSITAGQLTNIRNHQAYINVHSVNFPNGEIRGQLGVKRPVDFDGDGRQDLSVLRFPNVAPPGVSQITYWNRNSTSGDTAIAWGNANTDFPVPGDYDGDGRDDLALYRDGTPGTTETLKSYFFIFRSSDATGQFIQFGTDGDQGIARDYDGDGRTDPAVFRRGAALGNPAFWYVLRSTTGLLQDFQWGTTGNGTSSGDTPVPGDYDGDGRFDLAVYRFGGLTPNNTYLVLRSSTGTGQYQPFGNFTSDYILPGDYDGDGKYDFAVANTGATGASPMTWAVLQSSNGAVVQRVFGISSDLPVQGDYDGDARTDMAVFRSPGSFWIFRSFDNVAQNSLWGNAGDFPTATFDAR